jgi:5'-deoxynucleotidase YfbR-like HD superfamily hydrolase
MAKKMNTTTQIPNSSTAAKRKPTRGLTPERLHHAIFDAVASKRVLKTGYVRQPGGLYPGECDTIAAHSHAVSVLSVLIAHEIASDLERQCGVKLNMEDITLLSIFHDHGETRSGDTGAQSIATYGVCKLYELEEDALRACVADLSLAPRAMQLFDNYRKYSSPEALIVHAADILEGFEKAAGRFHDRPWVMEDAFRILAYNVCVFRDRLAAFPQNVALSRAGQFLADNVILPGTQLVADQYRIAVSVRDLVETRFREVRNVAPSLS